MKIRLILLYIICLTCNLLTAQTVQWSVKPTYSSLEEYVGKLYKYRENGKVGLVDISGKVLVEAKYDSITPFIDYHALALDFQGGNFMLKGIINQYNLKLVVVPQGYFPSKDDYDDYYSFSEGKLVVYDINRKYGYMQTDGSFFMDCKFYRAYPFYHGRALVYKDRSTAEYLKDDGTFLNTQMEEEDFCTLLPGYCSAFNEDGLARIIGKSSYGSKEMIIDVNGKKFAKVKLKNFKEREHFFSDTSNQLEVPITSHVLSVEEHGLFGFQVEGSDTLCVPSQFVEACSFKEGYAKVKQNDKYGVLKLIPNVSFSGNLLQDTVEVLNGKMDSLNYILKLPQQFSRMDWRLILKDDLGLAQSYSLKDDGMSGNCLISFKPDLKNKAQEKKYRLSLYVDGLLLWQDNEMVTFTYLYRNDVSASSPQVAEGYKSDDDGYLIARERRLSVSSLIKNQSTDVLEFDVMMGAMDRITRNVLGAKREKIRLASNAAYEFKFEIEGIDKKIELDVYIQIPANGIKENKIIKVKPIY